MATEVKALIVEDEVKAREALEDLIKMVRPDVKVIGVAVTVVEAISSIQKLSPDLIFLDIQLGNEHSFEILRRIPNGEFQVIFITAYSNYAVEAFKFSAVDYLLKPVDPLRLESAIAEAVSRMMKGRAAGNLHVLLENLQPANRPKKIVLSTMDFVHVVDTQTIIKCHSLINYTVFHLIGGKEIMVSKTLKEYDELLSPNGFFRAHKSWLINMNYVTGYNRKDGGAILEDGSEVPVAIAKKEEFMDVLRSFF
ncbi:MAG: LytTR family DNA-binding domain-containing protein [Cyclobacteriaceae bacterium]